MGGIALSAGIRQNLLSLQNTADLMSQTSNRLSTGKKVNSALDNPNSFFTAQGLSNRASDLSALQDGMGLATQTLQAADKGITAIQKLVDQAKSTANQALQAKATTTTLTSSTVSAVTGLSASNTKDLGIVIGGTTSTVSFSADVASASDVKTAIDAKGISGLTVTVDGGKLNFSVASGEDLSFAGDAADFNLGSDSSTNGTTLTEARKSYQDDFNSLRDQIDQLANDASFKGVNLLTGDSLTVNFNEDSSSKLTIKAQKSDGTAQKFDSSSLGISAAAFDNTDASITGAVSNLNAATNTLRAQSSSFGGNLSVVQNRQDFTKNMINTLQVGADNLTLADTNEEGANMLALQTRQSLSTTALSMASRADQAVLSFLR